jgi:hypothetical protein
MLPVLVISFPIGTIYESKKCGKTHPGICLKVVTSEKIGGSGVISTLGT